MPSYHMDRNKHRGNMFHAGGLRQHPQHGRGAGLLGSVPRYSPMHQGAQGLLGGAPHNPFRGPPHREHPPPRGIAVNPWEGGVIPGAHGLGSMRGGPHHSAGGYGPSMGGGPGLLGGRPNDAAMMGITQLAQMNNRESKMALNIINNVLGPNIPGPQFGPPPPKMRRLEQRIGVVGGARTIRGDSHHQSRPSGNLLPQDLRRRLKDRRGQSQPSTSSRQSGSSSAIASSGPLKSNEGSSSTDTKEKQPTDTASDESKKDADEQAVKPPAETSIPVEAIHCHICQLNKFSSRKAYLAHLAGSTHDEMARAFHNKNSAVLQLLRAEAKVAAQRQVIATRVAGEKVKLSQCFKCHCQVAGSLQKHIASVEHRLVNNFQILKCCNVWYSNRLDYEEHRLTFPHLLREHDAKQKKEKEEEAGLAKEDAEKKEEEEEDEEEEKEEEEEESTAVVKESWASAAAKAVKQLTLDGLASTPLTLATIKPYTGLYAVGEDMLACHGVVKCLACAEMVAPAMLDTHCRSNIHYNKVLQSIKQQEEAAKAAATKVKALKESNGDVKQTKENEQKETEETAIETMEKDASEDPMEEDDKDYDGQEDDALVEGDLMPLLEFEDGVEEEEDEEDEEEEEDAAAEEQLQDLEDEVQGEEDIQEQEEDEVEEQDEIQKDGDVLDEEEEDLEDEEKEMQETTEEMQHEDGVGKQLLVVEKVSTPAGRPSSSELDTPTTRRIQRTGKKRGLEDLDEKEEAEEKEEMEKDQQQPEKIMAEGANTPKRGRGRGRGRLVRR